MWFWFSVIALLFWSGSDLFSKIGCRDADDKYAHLKMVMAVGVVMGLHAAYEIFIGGKLISPSSSPICRCRCCTSCPWPWGMWG